MVTIDFTQSLIAFCAPVTNFQSCNDFSLIPFKAASGFKRCYCCFCETYILF